MDILCISSQVAYGPVGNSAAVPALEQAGHRVFQLPTTILSNHPGHCPPAMTDISAQTLGKSLETLEKQGWLDHCGSVMTGYFRDIQQIEAAADAISRLKEANPALIYMCDPVMGDDHTGHYVPMPVADAIRDSLVPLADFITPNRFELAWLASANIDDLKSASKAARALPCPTTLATSLPDKPGLIRTAVIEAAGSASISTVHRPHAPHGAGDLLSGLMLAGLADGSEPGPVLGKAMAMLEQVLTESGKTGVLAVPTALQSAADSAALPVEIHND